MEELTFCKPFPRDNQTELFYQLSQLGKGTGATLVVGPPPPVQFIPVLTDGSLQGEPVNPVFEGASMWVSVDNWHVSGLEYGLVIGSNPMPDGTHSTVLAAVLTMPNHDEVISKGIAEQCKQHLADLSVAHYFMARLFLPLAGWEHSYYERPQAVNQLSQHVAPQVINRFEDWVNSFQLRHNVNGWNVLRYGLRFF